MLLIDYAAEESIVWLDHGLIKVPELRLFVVLGAKKSLIEVEMNILALMGLLHNLIGIFLLLLWVFFAFWFI